MADQGKWFKLWCSAIHDQELQNLELDDWARWAILGTYIKEHGKDGKIRFEPPYRALLSLFRVGSFLDAISILKRFPNCTLGERSNTVTPVTNATVTLEIEYRNWFKYQGDFSNDRVRKFRDKKRHAVTAQEEKRREEKRQEENTPSPQDIDTFFQNYNTHRGSLPSAQALSERRKTKIRARLKEKPDQNYWVRVTQKLAASDLAQKWASLDWIIENSNNHVKAIEGNYDNRQMESQTVQAVI